MVLVWHSRTKGWAEIQYRKVGLVLQPTVPVLRKQSWMESDPVVMVVWYLGQDEQVCDPIWLAKVSRGQAWHTGTTSLNPFPFTILESSCWLENIPRSQLTVLEQTRLRVERGVEETYLLTAK